MGDLPLFQLKNNIRDKSKEVVNSVSDFLTKFEVIIGHHQGDVEECWESTLPLTLSNEQLSWFQYELTNKELTWSSVKHAFRNKYGGANHAAYLSEQLHEMKLKPKEDVIKYANRFTMLMREAEEEDGKTWGQIFVRSLTPDLQVGIKMTQSASGNKDLLTVARATELLASIYDSVKANDQGGATAFGSDENANNHASANPRPSKKPKRESTMHDQCKRQPGANHTNRECFSTKADSKNKDKGKGRAQGSTQESDEPCCWYCARA